MHTGAEQSNTIDVVADGIHLTLYINSIKVAATPDPSPSPLGLDLSGTDSFAANNREVIYTDARLWSL